MALTSFIFICTIALCSAVEDTQEKDTGVFPQDLREFVRRLTQQQMQTTQNMQPPLLPQLNLLRSRFEQAHPDVKSPLDLRNFRPQSMGGEPFGTLSRASSSVTMKRPYDGASVEAKASAYASVNDVDEEEHMGENFDSLHEKPMASDLRQNSPTSQESTPSIAESTRGGGEPHALKHQHIETVVKAEESFSDVYFVAIVAGCSAVGIFGVISAGICFYKLQKSRKAAADVDYPAYGVTGPNKDTSSPNGDRKLAQSAQMYHYQHQKQQMIAVEKAGSTKNTSASDVDSEEENEEGDYTVYECPGLAPTGEMEVKNPLFHDDSTPVSPPVLPSKPDSNQNN